MFEFQIKCPRSIFMLAFQADCCRKGIPHSFFSVPSSSYSFPLSLSGSLFCLEQDAFGLHVSEHICLRESSSCGWLCILLPLLAYYTLCLNGGNSSTGTESRNSMKSTKPERPRAPYLSSTIFELLRVVSLRINFEAAMSPLMLLRSRSTRNGLCLFD